MKKILATLLVASMLISCFSLVSFAANVEVNTISAYPYAEMTSGGYDMATMAFKDAVAKVYFANAAAQGANTGAIFMALQQTMMGAFSGGAPVATPASATPTDLVVYPINATGLMGVDLELEFDNEYLTYAGLVNGAMTLDGGLTDGVVTVSGMATEDASGLMGAVLFKVNADAVGNSSGEATTVIEGRQAEGKPAQGSAGYASFGNLSLSVALSGLVAGEDVVVKPSLADEATIDAIEATFTAFVPTGALVEGLAGDAFAAVFGTFDASAYAEEVVDYGFYYVAGSNGLRNADKSVKTADGKFGCIFYGTKWAVENGTAVFYVTYKDAEGITQTVYAD